MGRCPISVRWVETNKGDDASPIIRSRFVDREIRTAGQDSIFAPTPPLESLRMVISLAASTLSAQGWTPNWDPDSNERTQILMVDISRAYFNAKTSDDDPVYVELPDEAGAPEGMCALLKRHMYGTRRAAEGWQDEYSSTLVANGFTRGRASACVFTHLERGIAVSVHGDDFTATGPKHELDWFESMMKSHYELRGLGLGLTTTKRQPCSTVLSGGQIEVWNMKPIRARWSGSSSRSSLTPTESRV